MLRPSYKVHVILESLLHHKVLDVVKILSAEEDVRIFGSSGSVSESFHHRYPEFPHPTSTLYSSK